MALSSEEFHIFLAMHLKGFKPRQVADHFKISSTAESNIRFLACRAGILPVEKIGSWAANLPKNDPNTPNCLLYTSPSPRD